MSHLENKIKHELEELLFPHFSADFKMIISKLPEHNCKIKQRKTKARWLSAVVTALVAFICVAFWSQYKNMFIGLQSSSSRSSFSNSEITISSETATFSTPNIKSANSNIVHASNYSATHDEAEKVLKTKLPNLVNLGVNKHELIVSNGIAIGIKYFLQDGYVEIRTRPLKVAGYKEIEINGRPAYLNTHEDSISLMAHGEQLFFIISLYKNQNFDYAEQIMSQLLDFYETKE